MSIESDAAYKKEKIKALFEKVSKKALTALEEEKEGDQLSSKTERLITLSMELTNYF